MLIRLFNVSTAGTTALIPASRIVNEAAPSAVSTFPMYVQFSGANGVDDSAM